MTDLATALADTSMLDDFEGKSVRRAGVEMPAAAGGLRDALKVNPRQMLQGESGYLIVEFVVQKIKHEPIDKDEPAGDQERVHVLDIKGVTFADDGPLVSQLAEQVQTSRDRIKRAKDAAKGIGALPTDEEAQAHVELHNAGAHSSGLVPGCPKCGDEAAADAAERLDEPTPIAGRQRRKRGGDGDGGG